MKITDFAFKLNALETFTYSFKHKNDTFTEYIHGIIVEFLETDSDGAPVIVKINQISNLEDYLSGKEVNFTERIFRVVFLQPFVNYTLI